MFTIRAFNSNAFIFFSKNKFFFVVLGFRQFGLQFVVAAGQPVRSFPLELVIFTFF